MNDKNIQNSGTTSTASDDALERLFRHASPRQRPSEADEAAIRESLHAEWLAVTDRRIRNSRLKWAAAASLLIAVAVGFNAIGPNGLFVEPLMVASIERVAGNVVLAPEGGTSARSTLQSGAAISVDQVIWTNDGQAALELSTGGSLRLAANTRVAFLSAREIELQQGAVYFDSTSQDAANEPLAVHTPLGVVRDIGTQFIAQLEADTLSISVREGAVEVDRELGPIEAQFGERINLTSVGEVSRESVALYGDVWSWAEQLAHFDIDGRSVIEFLSWIERETGRRVLFAPGAEELASETLLHGSLDMEPMQMLRAALATTDIAFALDSRDIVVSLR